MNPEQFNFFKMPLAQTVQARLVLLVNHVLSAEPVAMQKLQPHAGKCMTLCWAPHQAIAAYPWLPKPEPLNLIISPAGLMELATSPIQSTLTVTVNSPALSDIWEMLRQRKQLSVQIEGDAQFAEALSWVAKNVRWDVAQDVQYWLGKTAASGLFMVQGRVEEIFSRWHKRNNERHTS